ncbi:hypothetical protein F903_02575 [Acinetobacter sp. NIPH 298]|nr:hypothetical protein F903_02575 [Acinetobacter sp. NIPH 298]
MYVKSLIAKNQLLNPIFVISQVEKSSLYYFYIQNKEGFNDDDENDSLQWI